MWQLFLNSHSNKTEFTYLAKDLLSSASEKIILALAGVSLVVFLGVTSTWPSEFRWNAAACIVPILLTCSVAYFLLRRIYILSQFVLQVGLFASVIITAAIFQKPDIMFLLVMLPLISAVTLGWQVGTLTEFVIFILIIFLGNHFSLPPLSIEQQLAIIIIGALSGLFGWASSSSFIISLEWFLYNSQKMQISLEETRQHRAQLSIIKHQLDQTNYFLERTNASLVAESHRAEEAERFKAEFVQNVSHELRTPLNLIIGFAEVMVTSPESYGGEPMPGAYRSDILAIYNSAKHLRALVDDVLDMGKLDLNKIALVKTEVAVPSLINEIERMVSDYIQAKGLELHIQLADNLPALWIDRLRIRQVLLNLLVNAVRFTEKGSIWLKVNIEANQIKFNVQDTGRGIPEGDLPHVFEPFHSGEQTSEQSWHSGTGLGLPISKKLVEIHGGQMGVEKVSLIGTNFWFTLPCNISKEKINIINFGGSIKSVVGLQKENTAVVVFPDEAVLTILQRQINEFNFIQAQSIIEGITIAEQIGAIAIIADASAKIKSPATRLPIITLPFASPLMVAAKLGAQNWLTVPVTGEQLLDSIRGIGTPLYRVLIVDDDPELVRLFRRILRGLFAPQNILEAFTNIEAIERITNEAPDIVLLDTKFLNREGNSLLTEIRSRPETFNLPVILVGEDYEEWARILGPIQISYKAGFHTLQLTRILQALLQSLIPISREPMPRVEPAE
jgi:signal transduction histidine kinase/CheY-like chemotaxis protein